MADAVLTAEGDMNLGRRLGQINALQRWWNLKVGSAYNTLATYAQHVHLQHV